MLPCDRRGPQPIIDRHRGDERHQQLPRIHGTAFPAKKELAAFFSPLAQTKLRDLRKSGRDLKLFVLDGAREVVERLNAGGFRAAGVSVPGDVSVVGLNNEDVAVVASPALTTIDAEIAASVSAAVDFLRDPLRRKGESTAHPRFLPPRLVLRESTGPARR